MIVLVVLVLIVGVLYYLFPIIRICGDSMYPTFKNGEIILFFTRIHRRNVFPGDVVAYKAPYDKKRIVIKRIDHLHFCSEGKPDFMYCIGDNLEPGQSYDSRNYGYVPLKNIVCKPIRQRKKVVNNEQ